MKPDMAMLPGQEAPLVPPMSQDGMQASVLNDSTVLQQDSNILQKDNNILQQDNTVLQQDKTVLQQDNTVQQQDKTVLKQDNTMLQQDCAALQQNKVVLQQGDAILQQDTVQQQGNAVLQQDNTMLQEDNTVQQQGNAVLQQDNAVLQQGNAVLQQGNAVLQQDSTVLQQGNAVLQQDNAVLQQDSTVLQQGNAVLQQDNAVLQQGNAVLQQGNAVLQQGNAVLQQDSTVLQQGNAVLQQDNAVLQQGNAVLQQGNAVLQQGNAVLQQDSTVLQQGNAVLQQDNAVLQQDNAPLPLLTTLVGALDASGCLHQVSGGAQAPSAVHLDLASLRGAAPEARRDFKAETLRRVQQHEVSRLSSVWCDADPAWALELLRAGAAVLEELGVCNPREEHLWAVHVMPRLRRLHLSVTDGALDASPPLLPALAQPSTLRWLGLNGLPRATAQSVLQAHGAALDVLVLFLGAEPGREWTRGCSDLDAFLGQCGLRLTQLVLWRWVDNHVPTVCAAQLEAARRAVMPSCSVRCSLCQRVPDKCFL